MSPSSSHFPSRKKPWVATGITVISAMPYLFRSRSRFASDDSPLTIIELREKRVINGRRPQVSGVRKTKSGSILVPDTCDLRPVSFFRLRFEAVVDLHLISGHQPISFVRHAHHGHQLFELRIGHALVYRRGGVRSDAVFALIRD